MEEVACKMKRSEIARFHQREETAILARIMKIAVDELIDEIGVRCNETRTNQSQVFDELAKMVNNISDEEDRPKMEMLPDDHLVSKVIAFLIQKCLAICSKYDILMDDVLFQMSRKNKQENVKQVNRNARVSEKTRQEKIEEKKEVKEKKVKKRVYRDSSSSEDEPLQYNDSLFKHVTFDELQKEYTMIQNGTLPGVPLHFYPMKKPSQESKVKKPSQERKAYKTVTVDEMENEFMMLEKDTAGLGSSHPFPMVTISAREEKPKEKNTEDGGTFKDLQLEIKGLSKEIEILRILIGSLLGGGESKI